MATVSVFSLHLLQTIARADTIYARMIPERGVLDWSSGVLQLIVLLLGIAALVAMVVLLITLKRAVERLQKIADEYAAEARPLIAKATEVVTDAREVVAMLRTDVERVTDAAGAISESLLDAADITARRVDDVNAVLDVLQDELEDSALSAAAAVRGIRGGARAWSHLLRPDRRQTDDDGLDDDADDDDDSDDSDDVDGLADEREDVDDDADAGLEPDPNDGRTHR